WGKADVFKNGDLLLKDYAAHFMVMERSRDPKTHEVHYPTKRTLPGGETDPAGMEIDLWMRSKDQKTKNCPADQPFIHLDSKEVEVPHLEQRIQAEPGDVLVPFPELEKSIPRRNFFAGFIYMLAGLIGLPMVWPVLRFIMKPMYAPFDNRWWQIGNIGHIK